MSKIYAAKERLIGPDEDDVGLGQRAKEAFADVTARQYLPDYLSALREQYDRRVEEMRRHQRTVLLMVIIFELISRAAIQGAQIGPVEVTDLSLVHKILPVVYGYALALTVSSNASLGRVAAIHDAAILTGYPTIAEHNIEKVLLGGGSMSDEYRQQPTTTLRKVLRILVRVEYLTIMAALSLAGIYMVLRLFQAYGFRDWIVWASVLVSVVLAFDGLVSYLYSLYLWKREF